MGMAKSIEVHDIIPLVNRVWAIYFAPKEPNMNAIRDRGWNPLNYSLLTYPLDAAMAIGGGALFKKGKVALDDEVEALV
eukprot:13115808-Ditylum_brightwellii.AAC.1